MRENFATGDRAVQRPTRLLAAALLALMTLAPPVNADSSLPTGANELHPLMASKYWAKAGGFFASRDVSLSARGSAGRGDQFIDFDSATGLDDRSDIFIMEFGWQFGEKWDFALQHFRSSREAGHEISGPIEWEDVVYEGGASIRARTATRITRLFFSRRAWDKGPHDFRLGAGLHLLEASASIEGEARLADMTAEYVASIVSAEFPFPDIGAWYRYSGSARWVFHTRVDWLAASTSDFSGGIWNAAAGVDFALSSNLGLGLSYQFFELNGTVKEETWRGDFVSRHEGLVLSLDGFW